MTIMSIRIQCTLFILLLAAAMPLGAATAKIKLDGKVLAVSAFAANKEDSPYLRVVQARVEEALVDNKITTLDEEKAKEMRVGYHLLEDPTAVITPEMALELQEKYKIDYVLNLYAQFDAEPGLGDYYSGSSSVELRLIDVTSASVLSVASTPMGVVGNPPSDGLTKKSAMINALQRATDEVLQGIGIEVFAPAEPRRVQIKLEGPVAAPSGAAPKMGGTGLNKSIASMASLTQMTWKREKATVTAKSPDGNYGAVGSYTLLRTLGNSGLSKRRNHGSRVHIIDLKTKRTPYILDFSELNVRKPYEKASKDILAMQFLGSWRFLIAVNGNEILFWDVETGKELSRIVHGRKSKRAAIGYFRAGDDGYLRIDLRGKPQYYKIVTGR